VRKVFCGTQISCASLGAGSAIFSLSKVAAFLGIGGKFRSAADISETTKKIFFPGKVRVCIDSSLKWPT